MTNNIQSALMKRWIAALESENPELPGFVYHVGFNPDCRPWERGSVVLFGADANVAYQLLSDAQIKRAWCKASDIADAAIVRAMRWAQ